MHRILMIWPLWWWGLCLAQLPHFVSHEGPEKAFPEVMHQDREGFIWAGTSQGLYRFDGREWIAFLHADSLGSQHVSAIGEGNGAFLWVGYEDGQIYSLREGKLHKFEPEEGLPKVAITGILQDSSGILWFATYGEGLYYHDGRYLYNLNRDDGLADNDLYALCQDTKGRIWTGSDGGLSRCWLEAGEKRVRNLGVEDGLPDHIVRSIVCSGNGYLWIGLYDHGFCRYEVDKDTFWVPGAAQDWGLGPVNELWVSGEQVWLGTGGKGLWMWDGQALQAVEATERTRIEALLGDSQGNLWVADNAGNIRSAQVRFGFLAGDWGNIQAIHSGSEGRLWFTTREGLFSLTPGQETVQKHALPAEMNAISLFEDARGYMWIGGFGSGVYRMHISSGHGRLYSESDGLINGNVLSITGNEQEVWLATLGGASRVKLGAELRFENFDRDDDPAISYLYHIFIDSKDRVWFASDGQGLSYLQNGAFSHFAELDGLTVYSVTEDPQGGIWFSTAEHGLFHYHDNSITRLGLEEGLADLYIPGLACDPGGMLIVPHHEGLDVLDPESLQFTFFGPEVGIGAIDPELNALTSDARGNIWMGTQQGIMRCGAAVGPVNQPHTRILGAKAYLQPLEGTEPRLSHDQNYLTFEYTGLWYQAPEEVRYQHRLLGFAPDWIPSRDQQVTYPHLPPGNYTFEVRSAVVPAFEQAEISSFSFVILPPIWQRWWFVLLCLVLLAGLGYGLIKLREQRLRKTERLEREKVEFQFETLKSQVNPHFLFNSFNTLITLIEEDSRGAVEYVEKLSDFFRTLLEYRSRTLISLREELELLEAYYFLQKKRYGDNLQLKIQLAAEEQDGQIAPLSLQMLVENAVKHNVVSRSKPLLVEIRRQGEYLIVRNPLQPKRRPAPSTGLGLQNIANRYLLLGDREVRIEKTDKDFIVAIPVLA